MLFTRDGRHLLAAFKGVCIYDANTGEAICEPLQPQGGVCSLALSPDGQVLATTDNHGQARLWELASRRPMSLIAPGIDCNEIAFAPDGRTLAVTVTNGSVVLLNWPSGTTVGRFAGEVSVGGWSRGIGFSANSRWLATTCSADSSVLIWDVSGMVNHPLPKVAKPSDEDLKAWWADLLQPNPDKAYQAIWRFAAVPEQALPFLANVLQPVKVPEPAAVARWIKNLDSDDFKVREQASLQLKQLGDTVVDALRQAKKGDISLEQRKRTELLLEELASAIPGPQQLRRSVRWRSWSTSDRRPES